IGPDEGIDFVLEGAVDALCARGCRECRRRRSGRAVAKLKACEELMDLRLNGTGIGKPLVVQGVKVFGVPSVDGWKRRLRFVRGILRRAVWGHWQSLTSSMKAARQRRSIL